MDYLGLLPIELWKEIFTQIPTHWTTGSDRSKDPLIFFQSHEFGLQDSVKSQSERVKLLGICKSLKPIVEVLVFSEVCLTSMERISKFVTAATIQGEGGNICGHWTRRIAIHMFTGDAAHDLPILDSLKPACPNLSSIQIMGDGLPASAWKEWMEAWKSDIKTLSWIDLDLGWVDMFNAACRLNHLTSLSISTFSTMETPTSEEPFVFPYVRQLDIDHHCLENFDIERLVTPSLKWLSLTLTSDASTEKASIFVQHHASTLVGIAITPGQGVRIHDILSSTIFHSPSLEVVLLKASPVEPSTQSSIQTNNHSSAVNTIYIQVTDLKSIPHLRSFIMDIKLSYFPHLSTVILTLHPQFDQAGKKDIEALVADPPISVTIISRIDPTRQSGLVYQPSMD